MVLAPALVLAITGEFHYPTLLAELTNKGQGCTGDPEDLGRNVRQGSLFCNDMLPFLFHYGANGTAEIGFAVMVLSGHFQVFLVFES